MTLALPRNPMADEYRELSESSRGRLKRAHDLLGEPQILTRRFCESVDQNRRFFAELGPDGEPEPLPFFDSDRDPGSRKQQYSPGLGNTPEVGELMAAQGTRLWEVLGAADLSFHYVERELLLTQAKDLPPDTTIGRVGLRIDLLLASSRGGVPIIAEVKVTQEKSGKPDADPFYALIQALTCATYLLPDEQQARLHRHDKRGLLDTGTGQLDIYVVTVREPPASKVWFELRDAAERLSAKVAPEIADWIRTIAFVELAWLDRPGGGGKRRPRVTKRFAVDCSCEETV